MTTLNRPADVAPPLPKTVDLRYHANILVMCILTVIAAFSLQLVDGDRVAFFFAPAHPLPTVCLCRAWFGINCPGCGLTRSFVCLAHGRWRAAEVFHPMGWIFALTVVLQFPYRIACLLGARPFPARWFLPVPWIALAALFAVWIVRLIL